MSSPTRRVPLGLTSEASRAAPPQLARSADAASAQASPQPVTASVDIESRMRKQRIHRLARSVDESSTEVLMLSKENRRLREILLREQRNRIHQRSESRTSESSKPRAVTSSPLPMKPPQVVDPLPEVSLPPRHDDSPTKVTKSKRNFRLFPITEFDKTLLVSSLPRELDNFRRKRREQFAAKEIAARQLVVADERTEFLVLHRALRLLREEEAMQQMRSVQKRKFFEDQDTVLLQELKQRVAMLREEKLWWERRVPQLEANLRQCIQQEEHNERKVLVAFHNREWTASSRSERRRLCSVGCERLNTERQCLEQRLSIVQLETTERDAIHTVFLEARNQVIIAKHNHTTGYYDDCRRKRQEARDKDELEEIRKRQAKQRAMEARNAEVRQLHHAWCEMEVLRLRLVRAEDEVWILLMKLFRWRQSNVNGDEKLQRVEGYFNKALHENPSILLCQRKDTAVAAAYAAQLGPAVEAAQALPNQKRVGMGTAASYAVPPRRDSEALPKHLGQFVDDETNPLFVGSHYALGGMVLDPNVEFAVDLGETWGPRLLICWQYFQQQRVKLSKMMLRRLLLGVEACENLAEIMSEDSSLKRLVTKKLLKKAGSTLAETRSTMFVNLMRDMCDNLPRWLEEPRAYFVSSLQILRQRFGDILKVDVPSMAMPAFACVSSDPQTPAEGNSGGAHRKSFVSFVDNPEKSTAIAALTISSETSPHDEDLQNPLPAQEFSLLVPGGEEPRRSSLASAASVSALDEMRDSLLDLKQSKEAISEATIRFRCDRMPAANLFAGGSDRCGSLSVAPSDLDAVKEAHPFANIEVSGGDGELLIRMNGIPRSARPIEVLENPTRNPFAEESDASRRFHFLSAVTVRDVVRLVRIRFEKDLKADAVPSSGLRCTVVAEITTKIRSVAAKITASSIRTLDDLVTLINEDPVDHEHTCCQELEYFLLPHQLEVQPISQLTAAIPQHDCRFGLPYYLFSSIGVRLCPRIVREEVECIVAVQSTHVTTSSGRVVRGSLQKGFREVKTVSSLPGGGSALTECESKGLEIDISVFDGFCLEDSLVFSDRSGSFAVTPSNELLFERQPVGTVTPNLCSIRITVNRSLPVAAINTLLRAVALQCGQFTSKVGIRVIQMSVSRPFDKANLCVASRWVPPSVIYVAVHIGATDTPPTFKTAERIAYRSPQAGGKSAATELSAKSFGRPPQRLALAATAVVFDPDTQFFSGGYISVTNMAYESGDFLVCDLKEYEEGCGVDGLRMSCVDSFAAAQRLLSDQDRLDLTPKRDLEEEAFTVIRLNGVIIAVAQVFFHQEHQDADHSSLPTVRSSMRRQSAVWGGQSRRKSNATLLSSFSRQASESSAAAASKWPQHQGASSSEDAGRSSSGNFEASFKAFESAIKFVDEEPSVQIPQSSLVASAEASGSKTIPVTDTMQRTPPVAGTVGGNAGDGGDDGVDGVPRLVLHFCHRVPFAAVQYLVRAMVYYRSGQIVPSGETPVEVCIALGPTIECFDVHGDPVAPQLGLASAADDSDGTLKQIITIERSPALLTPLDKDRVVQYLENSGVKRIFGKFAPLPSDLQVFEGGFLRVEIAAQDIEDEDELILDIPMEKMRRIFLNNEVLHSLLPNSLGMLKKKLVVGGANVKQEAAVIDDSVLVDSTVQNLAERRRSFHLLEVSPREPPTHSGPSVPTMRRLQSMRREQSGKNAGSPVSFVETADESATVPTAPQGASKWSQLRGGVQRTNVAHRFLEEASGNTMRKPEGDDMYRKIFGLVRQAAVSQVQTRRQAELEKHGIDDTFAQMLSRSFVSSTVARVCCLADYDNNGFGTLWDRKTCFSISFDAAPQATVLKGHTFAVKAASVMQWLIPNIAFRSTSRNPSILEKRILLTLSHPSIGTSVSTIKVVIDPVDDPTEITTDRTTVTVRLEATEREPLEAHEDVERVTQLRMKAGVNVAMPESSIASTAPCFPRQGIVPLFAPWLTTVFDPDTLVWDGGVVRVRITQAVANAMPQIVGKLNSLLRFMTVDEQRTIKEFQVQKGMLPSQFTLTARQSTTNGAAQDIFVSDSTQKKGSEGGRLIGSLTLSPTDLVLMELRLTAEPIADHRWIDVETVAYVLCSIAVETSAVAELLVPHKEGQLDAVREYPMIGVLIPLTVEVQDGANPIAGSVVINLDLQPPLLSPPKPQAAPPPPPNSDKKGATNKAGVATPTIPRSSSLNSVATSSAPRHTVITGVRSYSTPQGEPFLANLIVRLADRDKVGGGFIEVSSVSGMLPEDKIQLILPNNQITLTSDGTLNAKEGPIGKLYPMAQYIRIDFTGYPFEGKKAAGGKTSPPPSSTNDESASVTPQEVLSIGPKEGAQIMKQSNVKVFGRRLVMLLKSIFFKCDAAESSDLSAFAGDRHFLVTVCDGRYDAFGRLEVSTIEVTVSCSL